MNNIDILLLIEALTFIVILIFTSFQLVLNERKRNKYEKRQEDRENTILSGIGSLQTNIDEILVKITKIEFQKVKIQKDMIQHEVRIEQTEKDIKELFKIVAKGNNV